MTGLEIFLLIAGVAIMAVSFLFGEQMGSDNDGSYDAVVDEEKIKAAVNRQVEEALEEASGIVVENTEAELGRISNEKIMAVSDYSDGVLEEIRKNHEEVMFLYDMLNDKEEEIKNTVKDVEMVKASIKKMLRQKEKKQAEKKQHQVQDAGNQQQEMKAPQAVHTKEEVKDEIKKEIKREIKNEIVMEMHQEEKNAIPIEEMNNNQKILALYQKGMSNIDIAKELNLGLGEVRLVIDLYRTRGRES